VKPVKLSCTACRSEESGALWGTPDLPVSWLQSKITPTRLARGQILFQEGSDSLAVFCLKSGMVKLYKTGAQGEPYIIRLLGRGRLIGYRAVLAEEPFAATAEALTDCDVCVIPRALFFELLDNSKDVAKRLLRHTAWELRISEEQLLSQAQQTVRERTIRLLSLFLDECSPAGTQNVPIHLPLRRSEFAQMIGTTPESLSRVLHRLSESGLLQLTRREIFVRNPARLRAQADRLLDPI
jgi:CRP/FNR family transcriptional regulator